MVDPFLHKLPPMVHQLVTMSHIPPGGSPMAPRLVARLGTRRGVIPPTRAQHCDLWWFLREAQGVMDRLLLYGYGSMLLTINNEWLENMNEYDG